MGNQFFEGSSCKEICPLFEYIGDDCIAIREEFAWVHIPEILITTKAILLFFEYVDDQNILSIGSVKDLTNLLEESPKMNFYLTNNDLDFLIAFNDHEYLIGSSNLKESFYQLSEKSGIEIL